RAHRHRPTLLFSVRTSAALLDIDIPARGVPGVAAGDEAQTVLPGHRLIRLAVIDEKPLTRTRGDTLVAQVGPHRRHPFPAPVGGRWRMDDPGRRPGREAATRGRRKPRPDIVRPAVTGAATLAEEGTVGWVEDDHLDLMVPEKSVQPVQVGLA